jgi:tetratricopeptide (TPR) repeat protein
MKANNRNPLFLGLLFLVILMLAYSNHFNNDFHFDDSHTIVNNVHIRKLSNIPEFFTNPQMFSASPAHWGLRPVITTTLAIDYWLAGGLKPFYFHLSTFLWHILLCVLLFFVYKKLLSNTLHQKWRVYAAILAAGWFAIHTANAETLNYIISRSDVISTFCIVASFAVYHLFPAKRKYYFYLIPAMVGVFAKETMLVLVLILFFYKLLFEKDFSIIDLFKKKNVKHIIQIVVTLLPLFFVLVVLQVYTLSKVKAIDGITGHWGYYVLTQSYVWLRYFLAFFIPGNLSADSDWVVIKNVFDERILCGLIFVAALIITIIRTSVKNETRSIAFGLIWFAVSLLPTSLVPFAEVTNDHRMYFPFVGLMLSVVSFLGLKLTQVTQKIASLRKSIMVLSLLSVVLIGIHTFGVYQRNKVWKTEESLWLDVTVKSPANGRGLMNYGLTQMAKGNYDIANDFFQRSLIYNPYYHTLFINIGILKAATGKEAEANEYFQKAILYGPKYVEPYAYYAKFLLETNRLNESMFMAEKARTIDPYSVMALNTSMVVYSQLGFRDKLVDAANKTLSIQPGNATAIALLQKEKTKPEIITPAAKKPSTSDDYINLSLVYYNQKEYQKCIDACLKALELKPNNADAYNNIGAAYNQLGQWQEGIDACTKALQFNPNHKLALGNLNWAKSQLKK